MSLSQPQIYCLNVGCSQPLNPLSAKLCENCQTPLVNRYLWAVSPAAAQIPVQEIVADRYYVVAPQIWLDTRPDLTPYAPEPLPKDIMPYLRLSPQRLHIPQVYGYALLSTRFENAAILLLENAPIDDRGTLLPSMIQAWHSASPVRQIYWLWQILQLWKPLTGMGVASSLLLADNLRVEGWRVRLKQLYLDLSEASGSTLGETDINKGVSGSKQKQTASTQVMLKPQLQPSLPLLGEAWESWLREAQVSVAPQLKDIIQQLQAEDASLSEIAQQLNQLLLEQAAQLPLYSQVSSRSDRGSIPKHNEDSCYPTESDFGINPTQPSNQLVTHLSMVCDGIGGHEGGEIASQLAVKSLKLQAQALLTEVASETEILMPDLVREQLAATIRVANNLIASQNDAQQRESRRRMGTTLVMAFQLPQQVETAQGKSYSHELYLAHVGDSRAYWMTRDYCQQLTVDDDVSTREVRMGRSLYHHALTRSDAGALTQAIGTKDAELLRPTVQRLIIEEDGVLLLCSDGLSDNNLVEQYWADYAEPILTGQLSLESAVQSLIDLANEKNGHDNISVVLTSYQVSGDKKRFIDSETTTDPGIDDQEEQTWVETETDEGVPSEDSEMAEETTSRGWTQALKVMLGLLALLIFSGMVGLAAWLTLNPEASQLLRDRFPNNEQPEER